MIKPNSSEEIYNDLLNRIINLEIKPGNMISENKICEEYKVSRSVIRNVFTRLSQINFITIYPQRGTYVNEIDIERLRTALLIRMAIEKEMLYRFMKIEDKTKVINKMEFNIEQQEKFINEKEYIEKFRKLDEEFHNLIILSVENKDILSMINNYILHINRWRNIYIKSGFRMGKIISEHKAILKAIKNNDLFEALECMSRHIDTFARVDDVGEEYYDFFI